MNKKKAVMMQTLNFLVDRDFDVSLADSKTSCFDLLARRRSFVLMLKFLLNIDSVSSELAEDLKALANIFSAYPLLIGERTRRFEMQDGVLHNRYGINAVTWPTLVDIFSQDLYPTISSSRGGYYIKIDCEKLRSLRAGKKISVGELSDHLGVSRTMVYAYENSGLGMTLSTAIKLEEFLDTPLALPLQVFLIPSRTTGDLGVEKTEREAYAKLERIGFEIYPIKRAPFDAVTKGEDELMIAKLDNKKRKTLKEIRIIKDVSDVASCFAFVLTEASDAEENLEGVPVIKRNELERMESQDEFLEVLETRR
jgi:putative transcriptional regulator